jgi:hypothetical protein
VGMSIFGSASPLRPTESAWGRGGNLMTPNDWAALAAFCVWAGGIVGVVGLVAFYQMKSA